MNRGTNNVDITKELPTVISFCSGYGGIERGLDLAGFEHRVVCYVEIEAFAIANLVNKMERGQLPPAPIYTNLKTFPAHLFRDKVSLITGGYPCQPFSAAGKRLGDNDPRHLWPYIREHIRSIRPLRCFFENVEGHISLGLREVLSDLEGLGYSQTWGIFSAREVGAPHQRKRVYILANSSCRGIRHNDRPTSGEGWPAAEARREVVRQGDGEELPVRSESASSDSSDVGDSKSEHARDVSENVGSTSGEVNALINSGGSSRRDDRPYHGETMAGSDRQRSHGSWEGAETEGWSESTDCGTELADSLSPRSKTRISGQERPDEEGCPRELDHSNSEQCRWEATMQWPPEPDVGRVVDGCPDRVDRIRLLGNAVVPQTAAKAWITLSSINYSQPKVTE
jgi:DNA (cytosine-5)-methyltransferase 1